MPIFRMAAAAAILFALFPEQTSSVLRGASILSDEVKASVPDGARRAATAGAETCRTAPALCAELARTAVTSR